ncbi:MAG: hypothetical protein JJ850_05490 [Kordiimonadaceae bacterium]|nr:hypothetical protein [Kordiimonadaceae bacterium]MBO6568224.1 hypothetical protein [Kordiimonadaceae bacterium]MBO6964046.1 hypothetical protein [Kordiimonadaceae bacterium]
MTENQTANWQRLLGALLALLFFVLAAQMLFQPEDWYQGTPGVPETGPINVHFIRDIGAAFLMSCAAFTLFAIRKTPWEVVALGAIFPGIHGGIHAFGLLTGHSHASVAVDFFGVVVPGLLAVLLALLARHNQTKKGQK